MARGVNKVVLVGNLGQDPEVKYTQSGMCICQISLATTSVRKDKDGAQQERTEWHRVKLFGKLGEIAGEYLRKGKQVYIEGSIRYDKYTGKDGVEKYTTDIIADEMQMLGGGGRDDSPEPRQSSQERSSGKPATTDAPQGRDRVAQDGYGSQRGGSRPAARPATRPETPQNDLPMRGGAQHAGAPNPDNPYLHDTTDAGAPFDDDIPF